MKVFCSLLFLFLMLYQSLPASTYSDKNEYVGEERVNAVSTLSEESDCLGSDYNLGRIIGPSPIYNNLLLYWPENSFMLMDLFHTQTGMDDKFNFGGYGLGVLGHYKEHDALWVYMFPEFDFNCAAGPSNRFRGVFMPSNLLFMAQGGRTTSGFDRPFFMQNMYQWDFLSRDGKIRVSPDQLDNSFYYRPLLNAGQVGINMSLLHSFGDSDRTNYGAARSHISVGLLDKLQLDIDAQYNSATYTYHSPYYNNFKYVPEYFWFGSGLHFRSGNFAVNSGYTLNKEWVEAEVTRSHIISVKGAYIRGNSIGSVREVEGNWDDLFTPQMGEHQLYTSVGFDFNIVADNVENSYAGLSNSLKYGLLRTLTVGENLYLSDYGDEMNVKLELTALFSNIPHREYGPSEASKFEYIFGFWPEQGQVLLDIAYRLPFKKDKLTYWSQPIISLVSRSQLSLLSIMDNPLASSSLLTVPFQRSTVDGILVDRDLHLKIMAGLARKVIIVNVFEFRIDKMFEYRINKYELWGSNIDVAESEDNNFVYVNDIKTAFGDPHRILFILSGQIFGQSDKALNGKKKFDFILGCEVMAAF